MFMHVKNNKKMSKKQKIYKLQMRQPNGVELLHKIPTRVKFQWPNSLPITFSYIDLLFPVISTQINAIFFKFHKIWTQRTFLLATTKVLTTTYKIAHLERRSVIKFFTYP